MDFACWTARLAVVLDGPAGHEAPEQVLQQQRHLERLGFKVLRFTEGQVLEDLEWVLGAIRFAAETGGG